MKRTEHLAFCSKCTNRKMDFDRGIVCGLTDEYADFNDFCPKSEIDLEQLKIQLENAETLLLDCIGIHRRFKTSELLENNKEGQFSKDFFQKKSILSIKKRERGPIISFTEDGIEHKGTLYRWSQILDSQIQRFSSSNSWSYTLQIILYPCRLVEISIGTELHLPFLNKNYLLNRRPEEIGASLQYHKLEYWKRIRNYHKTDTK